MSSSVGVRRGKVSSSSRGLVKVLERTTDDDLVTDDASPLPRPARRVVRTLLAGAMLVAAGIAVSSTTPAVAAGDDDWLTTVNTYRAMSGLQPVNENTTWSAEATAHSCYMLQNGISHDEIPGRPGYTAGGDVAGNSGNVAVSSSISTTARDHVELWMTGPFHAIGVLRHSLRTSGFGLCAQDDTPTPWRSGGTLDVIRGIDHTAARPSSPIVFPGNGATVPLHSFITEFPNPLTMCGWTGSAGLPLIAMMPSDASTANSTLIGPNGPIETCTLHESNVSDSTARSILNGDNAVIVMPRAPLQDGTYTATVNSSGGNVTWSFDVDRDAPLSAATGPTTPDVPVTDTTPTSDKARFEPVAPFRLVDTRTGKGATRIAAKQVTRILVADPDIAAVSANFVAVTPDDHGFLTAYNCTDDVPAVSTLNYRVGEVVANQAVVPLDRGDICVYSLSSTDLVVDVNGYFHDDADSSFTPEEPVRIYDSREGGRQPLEPGRELEVVVAGSDRAAPGDATSVALNVTVAGPAGAGFLRVYPCGAKSGSEISTVNYAAFESRPNSVVVPVDAEGRICIRTHTRTDVIVDYTGYFSSDPGLDFVPLDPIRLFDSRSSAEAMNASTKGRRVGAGDEIRIEVAGMRGVPDEAVAASVNVTATEPLDGTFLTVYPCGTRPTTSTVNLLPQQASSANGAMVKLSAGGDLCIYAHRSVHVIVDINGAFV